MSEGKYHQLNDDAPVVWTWYDWLRYVCLPYSRTTSAGDESIAYLDS